MVAFVVAALFDEPLGQRHGTVIAVIKLAAITVASFVRGGVEEVGPTPGAEARDLGGRIGRLDGFRVRSQSSS